MTSAIDAGASSSRHGDLLRVDASFAAARWNELLGGTSLVKVGRRFQDDLSTGLPGECRAVQHDLIKLGVSEALAIEGSHVGLTRLVGLALFSTCGCLVNCSLRQRLTNSSLNWAVKAHA